MVSPTDTPSSIATSTKRWQAIRSLKNKEPPPDDTLGMAILERFRATDFTATVASTTPLQRTPFRNVKTCAAFFFRILLFGWIALVLAWAALFYYCGRIVYRILLLLVQVVDWNFIVLPWPFLWVVHHLQQLWMFIDNHVFLGRRYQYRDVPPDLSTTKIVIPQHASAETKEYLQSLLYCQTMLRKKEQRRPRREEKKDDGNTLPVVAQEQSTGASTSIHKATLAPPELLSPRDNNNDEDEIHEDMPWLDVGAKIGMRLLNSEHVQRAMAQPDTILEVIRPEPEPPLTDPRKKKLPKPVHNLWTPDISSQSERVHSPTSEVVDEEPNSLLDLRRSLSFPPSPAISRTTSPERQGGPDKFKVLDNENIGYVQNTPIGHRPWQQSSSSLSPPGIQRYPLPVGEDSPTKLQVQSPRFVPSRDTGVQKTPTTGSRKRASEVGQRRVPLQPGVKVAIPLCPIQPYGHSTTSKAYQMGTVVSSRRIFVGERKRPSRGETNCLSVTSKLEKSFLRNGEFAELTFRVMDEWSNRYMPRHSKVPIGSCVSTIFGIGVLVGWRVQDDIHVVRALWRNRGPGSSHAYLNRQAVYSTIEAAVGFYVQTEYGGGEVIAVTQLNNNMSSCRFMVRITDESKRHGEILSLDRKEILSCPGAQFMPVIEHVREAAHYQIQVDQYNAELREQRLQEEDASGEIDVMRWWADCADILWKSFLKAVEEDKDFDDGVNEFMASVVDFLDRLDKNDSEEDEESRDQIDEQLTCESEEIEVSLATTTATHEPGLWLVSDLFGGVFASDSDTVGTRITVHSSSMRRKPSYFDRAFALLRALMKTVSIARASSVDFPHFRLGLAVGYDFLLFIRTIVKIQKRNVSTQSLEVWKRAWSVIVATFGPIKERVERIGQGIALRMEKLGKKAKLRLFRFVDMILNDERLVFALEHGEWDRCFARIEIALVETEIIEAQNLSYYRKAARYVMHHMRMIMSGEGKAASRNTEKLMLFGSLVQAVAAPRRSILKFFCRDEVLELFERILVRAYNKEETATRMLTIHAANFHSLRQLRMLKDFSISGKIWIPLLNAADEEFSWLVSNLPENSKSIMCPLSNLFSLCVAQFHKINAGDTSRDWLAFLLEEDSVKIIHEIDMMLILALESFARDVREMINVLPYYASIDDDILNLMDEVNLDQFLKEVTDALDDPDKFNHYVREKSTIAVERFLNYLPKMSIPVEKRDLGDGWVLTCHGADGGGLTLTGVNIRRENLVCRVMGGDSLFFPMFTDEDSVVQASPAGTKPNTVESPPYMREEDSVLDHIRDLILNAQNYGCWEEGLGGVKKPPSDRYAASVLRGLPVTTVLNTGIELWRNLEIDDDELLQIAIRDISYHIELAEKHGKSGITDLQDPLEETMIKISQSFESQGTSLTASKSFESTRCTRTRFNPRVDPTVLFLEIKNLSLNLDDFFFRIEKEARQTIIFDPVFEGRGMLSLQNISIRLRVECAKERVHNKSNSEEATETIAPILQLRELDITLEKLLMTVHDTGFGSDWILNKAVDVFEHNLTQIVEENLQEKIREQIQNGIENLNSYFLLDPGLLLNILGITMDDLDENVVWV